MDFYNKKAQIKRQLQINKRQNTTEGHHLLTSSESHVPYMET